LSKTNHTVLTVNKVRQPESAVRVSDRAANITTEEKTRLIECYKVENCRIIPNGYVERVDRVIPVRIPNDENYTTTQTGSSQLRAVRN
jgi:hypothetical protein